MTLNGVVYELVAVVMHTMGRGRHYFTVVKSSNTECTVFDDGKDPEQHPIDRMHSFEAYHLVYKVSVALCVVYFFFVYF